MLLEAEDLRVDVSGVPVVDGLSMSLPGPRGIVVGAPRVLARALAGLAPIARGRLRIGDGEGPAGIALVPGDPRLPPKWTAEEYVTWNARLASVSAREAKTQAAAALARLELGAASRTRLDRAPPAVRLGAVVAAALVTGPRVVVFEDVTAGLAEDVAERFDAVLVAALAETPWIACLPRLPYAGAVAREATSALVVSGARVVVSGAPASLAQAARRFTARVVVARDASRGVAECLEDLGARLAERGGRVEPRGNEGAHVSLDLGPQLTTAELFGLALEARVVFVELSPAAPLPA